MTHEEENGCSDAQQTSRPWHRRTALCLAPSKYNVAIEAATRLVHRRAPVGVGPLRNRADRPSTGSRAPVAQSLNFLVSPSISEERIMNFYPTGNFRPLATPEQRLISE